MTPDEPTEGLPPPQEPLTNGDTADQPPVSRVKTGRTRKDVGSILERAQLIERMVAMKVGGLTYREIARRSGYGTKQAVHRAIWGYINGVPVQAIEELRAIENERLDTMHALLWQKLRSEADNPAVWFGAVDRLLRLSAQRCRLNGLDLQPALVVSPENGSGQPAVDTDPERDAIRTALRNAPVEDKQKLAEILRRMLAAPPGASSQ